MAQITGTPYDVEASQLALLQKIGQRVASMRATGSLTPEVLNTIRKYFRIKNIAVLYRL